MHQLSPEDSVSNYGDELSELNMSALSLEPASPQIILDRYKQLPAYPHCCIAHFSGIRDPDAHNKPLTECRGATRSKYPNCCLAHRNEFIGLNPPEFSTINCSATKRGIPLPERRSTTAASHDSRRYAPPTYSSQPSAPPEIATQPTTPLRRQPVSRIAKSLSASSIPLSPPSTKSFRTQASTLASSSISSTLVYDPISSTMVYGAPSSYPSTPTASHPPGPPALPAPDWAPSPVQVPRSESTDLRWYTITSGVKIGVFQGWANVGPWCYGIKNAQYGWYSSELKAYEAYKLVDDANLTRIVPRIMI